jgi:hypothetical protein
VRLGFDLQQTTTELESGPFGVSPGVSVRPRGGIRCPTPTLVCDSVSATKSKCGFEEFEGCVSDPPKFYLSRSTHFYGSGNATVQGGPCSGAPVHVTSFDQSFVDTYDPEDCSVLRHDCSGTSTETVYTDFNPPDCGHVDSSCSATFTCDGWSAGCQFYTCVFHDTTRTCDSTSQTTTETSQQPICNNGGAGDDISTEVLTLSDEYTTDLLVSTTEDALPAYFGYFGCNPGGCDNEAACEDGCDNPCPRNGQLAGQGCDCSASYFLSDNETSLYIRNSKFKWKVPRRPSGFYKVFWNETFKPILETDTTYCGNDYYEGQEDPNPSNWTCTAKSFDWSGATAGGKESTVLTLVHPSSNGTTYITDIRWSSKSSYTPTARVPCGLETYTSIDDDDESCPTSVGGQRNCTPAA